MSSLKIDEPFTENNLPGVLKWESEAKVVTLKIKNKLFLEWEPFSEKRGELSCSVLSPCCEGFLVYTYIPQKGSSPKKRFYCRLCEGYMPAGYIDCIRLIKEQGEWMLPPGEDEALTVLLQACDSRIEAEFLRISIIDFLVSFMSRADAEYAWLPEGNLRGNTKLSTVKKAALGEKLVNYFLQHTYN